MLTALQDIFLPKSFFTGSQLARRKSLLVFMLWAIGACSLSFYFIPHSDYNHIANLVGSGGYWTLLMALLLGAPYLFVANAALLWSMSYVAYLAAMTGGINSPVMVWMTVVTLPAILLLERMAVLFWVCMVFAITAALLCITKYGWINSDINMSNEVMAWTVANKLFVLGLALYVVFVTEYMHRRQVAEMESSNAELERTHQALLRAQAHKDEFIAAVGHELRTPMNAILGFNGILKTSWPANPKTPRWSTTSVALLSSCCKSSTISLTSLNSKSANFICTKTSLLCAKCSRVSWRRMPAKPKKKTFLSCSKPVQYTTCGSSAIVNG